MRNLGMGSDRSLCVAQAVMIDEDELLPNAKCKRRFLHGCHLCGEKWVPLFADKSRQQVCVSGTTTVNKHEDSAAATH